MVVEREPSDLGIDAGVAAVTQVEDGMELAVHEGSCIKAEPPESTSAQQQTENLSNDSCDDVPVISGKYIDQSIYVNKCSLYTFLRQSCPGYQIHALSLLYC